MNRTFFTIALVLCFFWACNKEALKISKPLSTECLHGSKKIEATYDSTVKDLEERINLSEAQILMLRSRTVTGPKNVQVMSPQEPLKYKAANPPE